MSESKRLLLLHILQGIRDSVIWGKWDNEARRQYDSLNKAIDLVIGAK